MATVTTACSFAPSASSKSLSGSSSRTLPKAHCTGNDSFPAGLRVLVVDDDPICLLILDRMLRRCQYTVTTCGRAADALAMLRENRDSYDVIISDVYMPDMDGFKLLELVGLEMDLPVIMMSVNGETSAVMKGIKHGACDYLLKPVRMEELRNIWQHVVRKKWRSSTHLVAADKEKGRHASDDSDHHSSANEGDHGTWKHGKRQREFKEDEDDDDLDPEDPSTTKKPRVVWSVELHQQFVNAVNQLGIDKAVPKRILELMNVHGLTRENVASHLQKYRLYLKRISGVAYQSGVLSPFSVSHDASFGSVSAAGLKSVGDFGAIGGSNELRSQVLLAGVLGKLNHANNLGIRNAEESNLLQLTALQGVDSGSFNQAPITPSYGQQALSESAVLQSGQRDANPVQLAQMGALSGLAFENLPLGLSTHQQQQLKSAVGIREFGQLPGASNFHQLNPNTGALIMQALQRQQGADTSLNDSGSMIPPSGGQQGISTDARIWATSISNLDGNIGVLDPLRGQCGLPSRVDSTPRACPGSSTQGPLAKSPDQDRECKGQQGLSTDAGVWRSVMSNLNGGGSAGNVPPSQDSPLLEIRFSESGAGSFERAYDVESKRSLSTNHRNVSPAVNTLSAASMAGSGPDHSVCHQMKDVTSSLATSNSMTAQNLVHGFPGIPGMKQEPRASQGAEGTWPGFNLGQDFVQVSNSTIQSPSYSSGGSSTTQGFPLLSDQGQSDLRGQVFTSGFASSFSADFNPVNKRQSKRITAENILKARVEGHAWIPEPLSDDLLSFVLQQQQEGLGLTE